MPGVKASPAVSDMTVASLRIFPRSAAQIQSIPTMYKRSGFNRWGHV